MNRIARCSFLCVIAAFVTSLTLQAQTPVSVASNYALTTTTTETWPAAYTFTQQFVAKNPGLIGEVGVNMGKNLTAYGAVVTIDVGSTRLFIKSFTGLVQRTSDAATVFPVLPSQAVKAGDVVTLNITPDTNVSMTPVLVANPDWPAGTINSHAAALKFFVNAMPPATLTITPSTVGSVFCATTGCSISCGYASTGVCSQTFPAGTSITLKALPKGTYLFMGWTGPAGTCSDMASTCAFKVMSNVTVQGNFTNGGPSTF
jgi:hypothetical protein